MKMLTKYYYFLKVKIQFSSHIGILLKQAKKDRLLQLFHAQLFQELAIECLIWKPIG